MKRLIPVLLILMAANLTFADTLTVKQNGTGDYLAIQAAIDEAVSGTVILVYPGTYYENVTYLGKAITLGSLYLVNQQDSIIGQTIIDGNQSGSCVRLENYEQNCRLVGFTLQNGSGTPFDGPANSVYINGGGIYLYHANLSLEHCIIKNNHAESGGAIGSIRSNLFLKGNLIFNNTANTYGGGIAFSSIDSPVSNIIFNEIDLNSIFMNYGPIGSDFFANEVAYVSKIILDTGTVELPNHYYFASLTPDRHPVNNLDITVNNWKIEQAEADLYVNPEGSDGNSGLTPSEPLKTISYALLKIKEDSIIKRSIHIEEGIYSSSATGEKLAFGLKSRVRLQGSGREKTIIDAENKTYFAIILPGEYECELSNFSFINGNGYSSFSLFTSGIYASHMHKLSLDSVRFENCKTYGSSGLYAQLIDTVLVRNCVFNNNTGSSIVGNFNGQYKESIYFEMVSSELNNNVYGEPLIIEYNGICIPLYFYTPYYPDKAIINANVINCLIADNQDSTSNNLPSTTGILASGNINLTIANSTIGNNFAYGQKSAAIGLVYSADVHIYNSIIYGNTPFQAFMAVEPMDESDSLYIHNTCFQDGINGVNDLGQYNYLYYDEETNISDDPLWLNAGDFPYALSGASPCIDAGTLDLPEGIVLPEFDLAGNPRIWGASVDMGAYEWSSVGVDEYQPLPKEKKKLLHAAPNPFSWQTEISADYNFNGKIKILVYDNRGQQVKTLMDIKTTGGKSVIRWTGNDNNNNILLPGIYYVVMYFNDSEVESLKVVKK